MAATPQFGEPPGGTPPPDRPAAFAVIRQAGLIAVVEVERPAWGLIVDLPGGGLDPGEGARAAATRECGEEAGLVVALDAEPFTLADHFYLHFDGVVRNTRGAFFSGQVLREDPALKIEADHKLIWMPPEAALIRLHREAHAWAVAVWLRLRARS